MSPPWVRRWGAEFDQPPATCLAQATWLVLAYGVPVLVRGLERVPPPERARQVRVLLLLPPEQQHPVAELPRQFETERTGLLPKRVVPRTKEEQRVRRPSLEECVS